MLVQCTCFHCGKPFARVKQDAKRSARNFCGRPCRAAAMVGQLRPLATRLAKRTQKTDACWLWTGGKHGNYGTIFSDGVHRGTHCVALELASGVPIPPGYDTAHTCDTPLCIRNDDVGTYEVRGVSYPRWGHLFLCPRAVNQYDKADKGRQARGATSGRRTQPEAFPIGSRRTNAKLTEAMVIEARALYAAKEANQVQLAARYGVRQCTIRRALVGITWAHVPNPMQHE